MVEKCAPIAYQRQCPEKGAQPWFWPEWLTSVSGLNRLGVDMISFPFSVLPHPVHPVNPVQNNFSGF
jgi:hypothetical protein